MTTPQISPDSAAALIAKFLKARGVSRVFALCGGHIMPIWMRLDAEGIGIVDVRDERAAVYMAHAYGASRYPLLPSAPPSSTPSWRRVASAPSRRAVTTPAPRRAARR